MHLIFPLSTKKDTGTLVVCNSLGGITSTRSLTMDRSERLTRTEHIIVIKEKPPDASPPIKTQGNYLDSQK